MRVIAWTVGCLAVLVAQPALAQTWRVTSERDAFEDSPTVTASVVGRGYQMGVRCKADLLEVMFIGGYVGEEDANVRYRFDDGEIHSDVWDSSTSRSGLFADAPGEMARWIMAGSRLAFEYEDFADTPHQYSISLAGSGAAVGRVMDACGVPRGDPRAGNTEIWRRAVIDIDRIERSAIGDLQNRLKEFGYEVAQDGRREPSTYRALSDFYSGYWDRCRAGETMTTSCTSWRSSLRYNSDADYPKEPVQLLIEVLREGLPEQSAETGDKAERASVITSPVWARTPMVDFPERALSRGVTSGAVTLDCAVQPNGSLTECLVVSEDPAGMGFGQAALAGARRARIAPATVAAAAPGARARWTVHFRPAEPPATVPTPAA